MIMPVIIIEKKKERKEVKQMKGSKVEKWLENWVREEAGINKENSKVNKFKQWLENWVKVK